MEVISLLSKRSIFGLGKINVVYTILKANAWRGLTADNFLVVLVFQKKTYKEQLLCHHLLLILRPCYNYHCICARSRVHSEIWEKK